MSTSFVLHKDSLSILEEMTDEQAGIFIKSIYQYQKNGTINDLDFGLKMAIFPFINQFKRDEEKRLSLIERNRQNGLHGGRPKLNNPENPLGFLETEDNQNEPNERHNKNKNKNENKNKNKNENNLSSDEVINYFNSKADKSKYQSGSDRKTIINYIHQSLKSGDTIEDIKLIIDYKLANPNTKNIDLTSWINTKYIGMNMSQAKEWQLKDRPDIPLYTQTSVATDNSHVITQDDYSPENVAKTFKIPTNKVPKW